jgi:hypothetical protein
MSTVASRFDASEGRDASLQMLGWEREEVVALLQSVEPLVRLSRDIKEYAALAVVQAEDYLRRQPGHADPHGLNVQQIACIILYTMENLGNPEQSFFKVLNRALNDRNRQGVVPFFPYIKLFSLS